ncbi:tyrosine-type recombinase/integrase [Acinetobacter sp. ANC 4636]
MPKIVKSLTDSKIKNLKADPDKHQRISDGLGLYLFIHKNGYKYWKFDYSRPFTKKRNTISFGIYPIVSLAEARHKRDEARTLLAQNIDPYSEKIRIENEILNANKNIFLEIAAEWFAKQDFAESTVKGQQRLLEVINQHIGKMPVHEIKPMDVLKVCQLYEKEGKLETAKKVKVKCGQILRYAVSIGLCERDPTQDLRGALKTPRAKHMAALVEPKDFALLLQDIDHYEGSAITRYALRIAPLVFVRPGELRHAKWQDIDLEKGLWCYTPPKTKLKTGVQHIVPLSTQVIHLLSELSQISRHKSEYVFPATTSNLKPMSENTINQALRRLSYTSEQVCGHGFRASARTILEEVLEFPIELIEQQLAHQVKDMHGRAYNRTKHLEKRKVMMQTWANYCDELKSSSQ